MSYKRYIRNITHWHEHEIHDKISRLLGYDTWLIGAGRTHRGCDPNCRLDLILTFRSREEYLLCRKAISETRNMKPE